MKRSLCAMAVALGGLVAQAQLPEIYDFSPRAARPGEILRIIGQDFDPVAANNVVYVGGVAARVRESWVTELEVEVPAAAQEGSITVATGGKIAVGPIPFQPLFAPFGQSNAVYRRTVQLPEFGYMGFATADLNRDGGAELLCVNGGARVDLFEYVPGGPFIDLDALQLRTQMTGSIGNTNLLMVDFDADGRIDVLLAGHSGFDLFRNIHESGMLDAGSFAPPVKVSQSVVGGGDFRLADLDRDGRMDVITRQNLGQSAQVNFNLNTYDPNTTNRWLGARKPITQNQNFIARHLATGDLNRDGHADVVVAAEDSIRIFSHNSPSGTNIQFIEVQIPTASAFVQLMDVEGDGLLDILSYDVRFGDYVVLRNWNPGGHLEAGDFERVALMQREVSTLPPKVLDLNGDGFQDIIRGTFGAGVYFENQSRFLTNIIFPGSFLTKTNSLTNAPVVVSVDLNRDGLQDMISHQGRVSVFQNITTLQAQVVRIGMFVGLPGSYTVQVVGKPYERVTLQSSANLQSWQDAGTIQLSEFGSRNFDAPESGKVGFFRTKPTP